MKLVQNGKAVFRFRKLAAMPFGFTAEAFGQALPIVLVGSLLFVLPGLFDSSVGQFDTSPLAGFLIMLVIGGVFACQAAVFSLTLTIAVRRLLPDGEGGALSRLADMKTLVEKVWPQFFGMLTGLVTFSFLFAFVTAMPFQSAFEKLASTGDPASALLTFISHILLEAINPWFWLFGAFAAYYFRTAAKRAIVTFESILDALDLEGRRRAFTDLHGRCKPQTLRVPRICAAFPVRIGFCGADKPDAGRRHFGIDQVSG